MEVKPVVAAVTQKLTDMLNDESVADNKVMMHQLKGVKKSLKKLQSFSQETDTSDASQRARDHLRVAYEVEDEIEKFTFAVARQRKRFGFLMKQTFFFNNLNSCRRLKRKIKRIQSSISSSAATPTSRSTISSSLHSKNDQWSFHNSLTSISDVSTDETNGEELHNDDDGIYDEAHELKQKSLSSVWPISEIPSTPSPKQRFLARSFSTIPHVQKQVQQRKKLMFSYSYKEEEMNIVGFKEERLQHLKQMSSFSYQEEEQGIFGLNDDIKSLVKRLTQHSDKHVSRFGDDFRSPAKQKPKQKGMFVPILGVPGSGKTTLARAVYRNRKIKDHFGFHDWISVMEEYTAERIMLSICMSKKVIKKDGGAMNTEDQAPQSRVFNHLKGKKYLIVLDGVGSCAVLEDLKDAFPDESNGSKILFTCREVWRSREMNIVPHMMNQLNEEERWNMFLKKAGKENEADQIEPRLKHRILDICGGLPLNIVLIAGLLSTKRTKRWPSAISRDQSSDEVLLMCYNDLNIHAKLCLLYLALFPKDYDIPVRRLLRLWLAEGFVKRRSQERFPEDLVQKYFEDLVDRSMIQITKLRSDNSPRQCRLVSVLHDYLLPKAQDISLFYIHRSSEYFDDAAAPFGVRRMVQHMSTTGAIPTSTRARMKVGREKEEGATLSSSEGSLSCCSLRRQENTPTEMATSHTIPSDFQQSQSQSSTFDPSLLRSYVSFNFQRKDMPEKEVGILLGRIINRGFGLLRVLDLEGVCKPSLPDKLGHLCHLRYLGLRWTFLESLPESVGDLSYLETLDVKHTRVDSLPDSIWKLKQLRHLNLNNIRLALPPRSPLTLLTLWGLVLDEKILANEGFGKLLDLRELGIKFHLGKSQGVLLDWIAKLVHLQSLRLTSVNDMGRPSKLVLKTLVKLDKLSHLNLYGNLERLPALNEFPPSIKVLTLSISLLNEDPMETLEQLPCLIVLRLLASSFTGDKMVCHRGGFKKLRVLKLWMLKELEEWDVEEEAMESLKELDIRCCHKLNNIPSRLLHKQRCLEELILTDMPEDFVDRVNRRRSEDTSLTVNPWKFAP